MSLPMLADATVPALGTWEIAGTQILVLAVVVLYLGEFITRHWRFLQHNNIPTPVTGGLIVSVIFSVLGIAGVLDVTFDMTIRDTLLLSFFSTIGLGAKMKMLVSGGKALVVLVAGCTVFLIVQDFTGVLISTLMGKHPGFGLLGGSVSFAGGHGTAIAWGEEATKAGIEGAAEFGIACATIGLIVGGLIGGPVAGRIIRKRGLKPKPEQAPEPTPKPDAPTDPGKKFAQPLDLTVNHAIGTILALSLCLGVGDAVNRYLFAADIKLPGFLTAMMVGILLTNLADPLKIKLNKPAIDLVGGVSLQLFLAMSLMSMNLQSLVGTASFLLLMVMAQSVAITLFAVFVVFRIMGRDYDAAVISGGFMGLGLGATPVAIANMDAITRKHGPSAKALLVVPLVGAFFIDLANAVVIKAFIAMPWIQRLAQ